MVLPIRGTHRVKSNFVVVVFPSATIELNVNHDNKLTSAQPFKAEDRKNYFLL